MRTGEAVIGMPAGKVVRPSIESASMALAALLLVIVTFFVRGQWFGSSFGSVTYVLPAISALLVSLFLMVQLWRLGAVALPPAPYLLLAIASAFNLSINAVFFLPHLREVAVFGAELALNGIVFLVAYNLGRPGAGAVDGILRLIQRAGVISGVILAALLLSTDSFTRLSFVATGVNHLGHALAIFAMVSLYRVLVEIRSGRHLRALASFGALVGALFFLFVSGTRSAMAGLAVALVVLVWLRGRRPELVVFYPLLLMAFIGLAVLFLQADAFGRLLTRFDVHSVSLGIGSRVAQWREVFAISTPWSVAFGAPWLYEAISAAPVVYPHNVLLSVGLYMGALPLALITWVIATRLIQLYRRSRRVRDDLLSAALLGVLLIALFYAFLSGSFTRIFTIVFLLGVVEAWLQSRPGAGEAGTVVGAEEPIS